MNKILLQFDEDCVKLLLKELDGDLQAVEEILGIEFARSNGEFDSDCSGPESTDYDKLGELEKLAVDTSSWRKLDEHGLPDQYPCVAVYLFEKSFDRLGVITTEVLEYIYLGDFNPGEAQEDLPSC